MLRKIQFHGAEAETIELDIDTAGEAVRALSVVKPELVDRLKTGSWRVIRGDVESGHLIELESLNDFRLGHAELHFVPAIAGAKEGGATLKTVLGVAMIGAAFAFSGGTLAAPLMVGNMATGMAWGNVAFIGLGLALSGASAMLSPAEKDKDRNENSFVFNGPSNISAQGVPVPLVYGRVITGGVLISGGLDIERISV